MGQQPTAPRLDLAYRTTGSGSWMWAFMAFMGVGGEGAVPLWG